MREYSRTQTPSGAPSDLPGSRHLSAAPLRVQRPTPASASPRRVLRLTPSGRTTRLAGITAPPGEPPRRRSPGSTSPQQPKLELYGLLTTEEAASVLNLSPWTLRHWVLDQRIRCMRLGRLVRFRLADLEAFIDARPNIKSKVG